MSWFLDSSSWLISGSLEVSGSRLGDWCQFSSCVSRTHEYPEAGARAHCSRQVAAGPAYLNIVLHTCQASLRRGKGHHSAPGMASSFGAPGALNKPNQLQAPLVTKNMRVRMW